MSIRSKVRARIVASLVVLGVLYCAAAHAAPSKKHAKKGKETQSVTYIDASGPVDSSPFPTVVDKGKL